MIGANWRTSPRINRIPLSGGDHKAHAKGIRYAHGIHENHDRQTVLGALPRRKPATLTDWNAKPGTQSCGPADRFRRPVTLKPSP